MKALKSISVLAIVLGLGSAGRCYEIKTENFGLMEVNGVLSGYSITGNKINQEAKKSRTDLGSALISFSKKAEPVGFTLTGGTYSFPTLGVDLSKSSEYTDLFSPLPVAYLEANFFKNFSLSIGRMGTLIGYEAPFTFQNSYIQRGLVWNMQPVFHHGLRLSYNGEKLSFKIGLNDGYFSLGVDSFRKEGKSTRKFSSTLETSLSLSLFKDLLLSFNLLVPDKDAYPNEAAFPSNKRQYNFVLSYTKSPFSLSLDQVFVEAPKSKKAQVSDKAQAYGTALHLSYEKTPFKFSTRLEYVKDKKDKGFIDLVGLGNKNEALSFTLSPGYYKSSFFARIELSYLKAKEEFTYKPKDHQTRLGFELGFKF
ncbi:MAG: porin [Thermodesulfobacteriaceae bacterium]|nr:porin [Thermodesulfobacteriaceae bacterium]MCX8041800.1 porin [Thermodesulfobacteriaceae bacterium]MDW8136176.1 outer membrane beta-barrel protein [Thermodesulfobacterium sp.]